MKRLTIKTKGWTDIIDITDEVQNEINELQKAEGLVHLFVIGSTASLTTIESDENLFEDVVDVLEQLAPYKKNWKHHKTWRDDNGAAHIRATLIGPQLTVPFFKGKLLLGTWQKIVLIDFDTRPRTREIIINVVRS